MTTYKMQNIILVFSYFSDQIFNYLNTEKKQAHLSTLQPTSVNQFLDF